MECQTVRMLLAFTQRRVESIDGDERKAVEQHLETCPDCAAWAQAEAAFDQALAPAMRDVPVPVQLKTKLLTKLAEQRRPSPWRWVGVSTAAAVLLMLGFGTYWMFFSTVQVDTAVLNDLDARARATPTQVEDWFWEQQDLKMKVPGQFDHRFLVTFDAVMFQGRRVPKLIYSSGAETAQILVLPRKQFDVGEIRRVPGTSNTYVTQADDENKYVYLICYTGSGPDPFLRRGG
jgi:Putative zinc-finger